MNIHQLYKSWKFSKKCNMYLIQATFLENMISKYCVFLQGFALESPYHLAVVSGAHFTQGTICSVYIPPSFSLNSQHLDSLLQQLSSLYIIFGVLNGLNILWGNKNNVSRGELIENYLTKNDICIMNDKSYTYLSSSAKSF